MGIGSPVKINLYVMKPFELLDGQIGRLWLLSEDIQVSEHSLKMPNHVNLFYGMDTSADRDSKTALELW